MKRIFLLFLCAALLLPCCLAGCGNAANADPEATEPSENAENPAEEGTKKPSNKKPSSSSTNNEIEEEPAFCNKRMSIGTKEIATLKVVADTTDSCVAYAAGEFDKYMTLMGFVINSDGIAVNLVYDESLGEDSYRIDVAEDSITVSGGTGRGIIYGVYGFLDKYAGVRFLTPTVEYCTRDNIQLEAGTSYTYTPVFQLRQVDWYSARLSSEWMVKNGINYCNWTSTFAENMGGSASYGGLFVHTLGTLTGTSDSAQPCLSDPENLEKTITYIRNLLLNKPEINIVSVSQNDNSNYCRCAKCAATDEEEGSPAGTLLRFVNAVAADLAEDYPDLTIDTLAYRYTQKAPSITKPLPNVCIRLCPIGCHFTKTLNDDSCPENATLCNDLLEWSEICDNIYIWDYSNNYAYSIATFPNFGVLRENMAFFADHHVTGMFPQGNYYSTSGEFGELRVYLLAKLMMNPYMTEEEYSRHINDFLKGYYGAGWMNIRVYLDAVTAASLGNCQGIYDDPFVGVSRETYESLEQVFDLCWDRAEELSGSKLDNVKRSRLQWSYIKLCLNPDKTEAEAFVRTVQRYSVHWREGSGTNLPAKADMTKSPLQWFK